MDRLMKSLENRIRLLQRYDINPIVVFDGKPLKNKQDTNIKRSKLRTEALQQAENLYKHGKYDLAAQKYAQSASVTPQMVKQFLNLLNTMRIDYIVAPYQADAQLAYLSINNHVEAVLTQDSDLIIYGCKNLIYKMDSDGFGYQIDINDLPQAKQLKLKMSGKYEIPKGYEDNFIRAYLTFKFQRVYCPEKEELVHLHDPSIHKYGGLLKNQENLDFLGQDISNSQVCKIAKGEIHAPSGKNWSNVKKRSKQEEVTVTGYFQDFRLSRHQERRSNRKSAHKLSPNFQIQQDKIESPNRFQQTLEIPSDSFLDNVGGKKNSTSQIEDIDKFAFKPVKNNFKQSTHYQKKSSLTNSLNKREQSQGLSCFRVSDAIQQEQKEEQKQQKQQQQQKQQKEQQQQKQNKQKNIPYQEEKKVPSTTKKTLTLQQKLRQRSKYQQMSNQQLFQALDNQIYKSTKNEPRRFSHFVQNQQPQPPSKYYEKLKKRNKTIERTLNTIQKYLQKKL